MLATPILRAEGLKKHFPVTRGLLWSKVIGWVQAVDGISFSIPQGETLALVGGCGCGKTTTAKLILRLERPTSGQVFVDGKDVHVLNGDALKEYRTMVQAVFQDPWSSLSPRMRVQQIVAEPLVVNRQVSSEGVKERVAEILAAVGLRPQQANLYPHEFSGGQRQRIRVASPPGSRAKTLIPGEAASAPAPSTPPSPPPSSAPGSPSGPRWPAPGCRPRSSSSWTSRSQPWTFRFG